MVFDSPVFVFLFFPVLLLLYCVWPRKARNLLLLAASFLFCAWGEVHSLWVLITSILGNYALGLIIERTHARTSRRVILGLAVSANLALLLYYKYLRFAIVNLAALGVAGASHFDFAGWRLPLGISFFTFAAIAYQVDIYAARTRAERNLIDFGLYLSHFAKLVAGPIVRYRDVAGELRAHETTLKGFAEGVQRFVIGLGKKVLVANSVAVFADEVFKNPGGIDMPTAWLGIACYTIQLYFDFSGYSDMAIGLGECLDSLLWRISTTLISLSPSMNSGAAGTFRSHPGSVITSMFHSGETGLRQRDPTLTSRWFFYSAVCGTGRVGTSSSGGLITGSSWLWNGPGSGVR